jgi:DHA2 family multidrug resistance protein-like MFS transporter
MSGSADGLPMPRRLWAIVTLALGLAMAVLTGTLANLALPTISREFGVSASEAIWVSNAYQLAVTMTLLPLASLGEKLGYRRVYLWGLVVFTLASGACALSQTMEQLVAARVVQGLGAAGVMSVNTALIRFIYPSAQLGRGVGYNAMIGGTCSALGPSIASAILAVADWHMLFAVNLPLGVLALLIGRRVLPASPLGEQKFDPGSAALNAAFFGLLILGIDGVGHGQDRMVVGLELLGAAVVGVALVLRQLPQAKPLLPVDLFRRPVFALSVAASVCSFAAQSMAFTSLPFFLVQDLGRTQTETGLLMTPWSAAMALTAIFAGRVSDRFSPAIVGGLGQAALCLGLLGLAAGPWAFGAAGVAWWVIVAPTVLCGVGFGLFNSPNNRTIMAAAPRSRSGGASGMQATSRLLGQTIGSALVALMFNLFPGPGTPLVLVVAAGFSVAAGGLSLARPRGGE